MVRADKLLDMLEILPAEFGSCWLFGVSMNGGCGLTWLVLMVSGFFLPVYLIFGSSFFL